MQLVLTIDPAPSEVEVARLLRYAAAMIADGRCHGTLRDLNGDTVGSWHYTQDPEVSLDIAAMNKTWAEDDGAK